MNVSRCKPAIELHKILKPTGFTNHNTSVATIDTIRWLKNRVSDFKKSTRTHSK